MNRLRLADGRYITWMVSEFKDPLLVLDPGGQMASEYLARDYWNDPKVWPTLDDGLSFPLPRNWMLVPVDGDWTPPPRPTQFNLPTNISLPTLQAMQQRAKTFGQLRKAQAVKAQRSFKKP